MLQYGSISKHYSKLSKLYTKGQIYTIFMQMGSRVVVGRGCEERETAIYCLMGAEFQSGMMIKF